MERPAEAMNFETLLQKAGFKESDFDEPWIKEAFIYRAVLSGLADAFWPHNNITSFEYTLDEEGEKVVELGFVLEIQAEQPEDEAGSHALAVDKELEAYQKLREFLKRNQALIPPTLRKKYRFTLTDNFIGGGLIITEKDIRDITAAEYKELYSDEIVPWGGERKPGVERNFFEKWGKFSKLVKEEIKQRAQK